MLNLSTQNPILDGSQDDAVEQPSPVTYAARHTGSDGPGSSRVYAGMWGTPEIAVVTAGVVAVIASVAVFVLAVLPARGELEASRREKSKVADQVVSAREKYGKITSTTEQVARLVASADGFEANFLPPDSTGRTELYDRINSLIGSHRLINTAGPEYVYLAPTTEGPRSGGEGETGREKFRSIFPGVYVTMTVDGTYQDIRRFISDIETSSQFVIISAVGIEPAEERRRAEAPETPGSGGQVNVPGIPGAAMGPGTAGGSSGVKRGETVSLKIELAGYFRRGSVVATQ